MSNLLYTASHRLLDAYVRGLMSLHIELQAELPAGPKLLVANHPTTSDPLLLTLLTEERIHTLITELVFEMPLIGGALRQAGHVPVIAGRGHEAFCAAQELLDNGHNVAIFPEGALSPARGGVYPLRNGAARLALATGAAVIPVGIALDPERIHRLDIARLYLRGPYAMSVGAPLQFSGSADNRQRVLGVSGRIRHEIIRLTWHSGQRLGLAQPALMQPGLGWAQAAGLA